MTMVERIAKIHASLEGLPREFREGDLARRLAVAESTIEALRNDLAEVEDHRPFDPFGNEAETPSVPQI